MAADGNVYAIVKNIPKSFRSCDLRNFFSHFTEKGKFKCFHYRHRPEKLLRKLLNNADSSNETHNNRELTQSKTCFCVIKLEPSNLEEFIKLYNGNFWIDRDGDLLPLKCLISKFDPDIETTSDETQENCPNFKHFPELHPPIVMPNGNVGTPTDVFLGLIRSCQLPPAIIKKLKLEFPMTKGKRKYSSVPYDYGGMTVSSYVPPEERVLTGTGHELSDKYYPPAPKPVLSENIEEEDEDTDASSSDCEDWERHESLHDDVTQQERTKERLYEEEIELQWEKGGSGLVFYTDAQYWDEQEGDFDAKTADDWDIDMSGYYEKDGGDKDARDYLRMRREQALRNGTKESFPLYPYKNTKEAISGRRQFVTNIQTEPKIKVRQKKQKKGYRNLGIGKFELHTKGIGRKILEKYGWKDGEGLGNSVSGITDALDNDGQNPHNKSGLGYHGEKLNRFIGGKKTRRNLECS